MTLMEPSEPSGSHVISALKKTGVRHVAALPTYYLCRPALAAFQRSRSDIDPAIQKRLRLLDLCGALHYTIDDYAHTQNCLDLGRLECDRNSLFQARSPRA